MWLIREKSVRIWATARQLRLTFEMSAHMEISDTFSMIQNFHNNNEIH